MPTYFCDSLKDVSIFNSVVRLEFQRIEAAAAGDNRELRMVSEFTVAIPIQGLAQTLSLLDTVRERLVREGVLRPPAGGAPETVPPAATAARSPNF